MKRSALLFILVSLFFSFRVAAQCELVDLIVTNPDPVCFPATVNLTSSGITTGSTGITTLTYWTDASATISYDTPSTASAGTYYIKGTDGAGCEDIEAVTVTVNPVPVPTISGPSFAGVGTTGNNYTTESGMSSYIWDIPSGGTITSGSGTNSILVTWNSGGTYLVTVNYTSAGCTASSPTVYNVSTNELPKAENATILGDPRAGLTLYATYNYSDAEGDTEGTSVFQWYRSAYADGHDSDPITSATGLSYRMTDSDLGNYIGFSVTPVALTGALTGNLTLATDWSGQVYNDEPVATSVYVTGSYNVYSGIIGHYTYSDTEGDIEDGTTYQWYSSETLTGSYSIITGSTGLVHVIDLDEQGYFFKFTVTPRAATGDRNGDPVQSLTGFGPANTMPEATVSSVTGTTAIGSVLTGNYTYSDIDGDAEDLASTSFRWLRDGDPILGATNKTYTISPADEGYRLRFEVTPISATGYPDKGDAVTSAETAVVFDASDTRPEARDVCIEGIRQTGSIIKGKYTFYYPHSNDDRSIYRWMRDNDTIPGATSIEYTITSTDINKEIYFVVIPKTKPPANKKGTAVKSNPLARINIPQDDYSVAVDEVTLTANISGGVFSGPGVSNGIFSPSEVGVTGSPYTIQYLLNVVNTTTTCSQKTTKLVGVTSNPTYFDGFNAVYCHDNGPDVITVANLPVGSVPLGFSLTNPSGIVSQSGSTVTIDPGRMRPGVNVDVLHFLYFYNLYIYRISQSFKIDSVGESLDLLNLDAAYCIDDPKSTVTVTGIFPSGGTSIWTGTIITDKTTSSAAVDPDLGSTGVTYPVTYQYKSPDGCYSNIINRNVTINPLPNPAFTLGASYNIDGGPVNLVPVQSGGVFTGDGVSGNRLFPDIAGLGDHTITYNITDSNNCTDQLPLTTSVRKAQGYFTGIPSVVCYRDTTYNVRAEGLPASGVSITGMTNSKNTIVYTPLADNGFYNIADAGAGTDTIFFSYTWDGIGYEIFKTVSIDSLGQVTIGNLLPGDELCNNVAPFELFTSHSGGVFSGPVVGGYLDPARATGNTTVTYTYTNLKTGCKIATEVPITIFPAPAVSFLPKDVCIINNTDTTLFVNSTVSADPVQSWLWEFSEAGISVTRTQKEPGYLFKTGGIHLVTLTATTINACTATKTSPIDLGIKPVADFYWESECFHENDSIKLYDSSNSFTAILSRSWNFFDGDSIHTTLNPSYPKKSVGYLPVSYIVRTKYAECHDTIFREIPIRKTIALSGDDYFENFESGNGGWLKDSELTNNWTLGDPDRNIISYAASGSNAWFTKFNTTTPAIESSSVESPCFDFTEIERPMISLKLWKRFDKNRDGAALQYKTSDNSEWEYLGTLNDGINWFNSTLIKGRPGGDQIGWTTGTLPDTSWALASHKLDLLKGKKDVRFRIAYGSDGTSQDNDGAAFDDIWIGDRTRNVLLEHFTNSSSPASRLSNAIVNSVAAEASDDVINIQYHTNFPGSDIFYNDNPDDASARILYYGLSRAPYSMIDGGTRLHFASVYDFVSAEIDSTDLIRRSLISPSFNIILDTEVNGNDLSVNTSIEALENLDEANVTLYLVVTARELVFNNASPNGERVFKNVFRKMIPDAGGIDLKKQWTKGDKVQIEEESWSIEDVYDASDIEIVAYIQNNVTKEIYQAEKSSQNIRVVGIENNPEETSPQFVIYPNPATDRVTLGFDKLTEPNTNIWIYNYAGTVLKMYKTGGSQIEYTIENSDLANGIYLVRVFSDAFDYGFRRLVISGR